MLSTNGCTGNLEIPLAMTSSPDDLRKRIVKLQWIGMEDEAERLGRLLAQSKTAYGVWMGPRDTD